MVSLTSRERMPLSWSESWSGFWSGTSSGFSFLEVAAAGASLTCRERLPKAWRWSSGRCWSGSWGRSCRWCSLRRCPRFFPDCLRELIVLPLGTPLAATTEKRLLAQLGITVCLWRHQNRQCVSVVVRQCGWQITIKMGEWLPEQVLWPIFFWVLECFVEQELLLSGSWDGSSIGQSNIGWSWSLSCSCNVVSWIVC